MTVPKNDLQVAIAAAREAVAEVERIKAEYKEEPFIKAFVLADLLAALDAAQPVATVTSSNTAMTFSVVTPGFPDGTLLYAAPQAPPAAPRVERYGEGVLVHWPEGVEQYVQVGDCRTAMIAAAREGE